MTKIIQTPVNIGPVPRCIKVSEGSVDAGLFAVTLIACLTTLILVRLHR